MVAGIYETLGARASLVDSFTGVIERVYESLVVVQSGRQGVGAGLVWNREGAILTNNHVAGRGNHLRVRLPDGVEKEARLLARKPEADLALLQIEPGEYTPAWIGDSLGLRVGELVLAVGHPWGQPGYVTLGMVSALGQAVGANGQSPIPVIRSDAALAPGNSGGPLINAMGAVVGINTLIVGGDQGVAIPVHVAVQFAEHTLVQKNGSGRLSEGYV